MPARELLYTVIESSYGTAKSTPVLGTDACYHRITESNAYTPEMKPLIEVIESDMGDGIVVPAEYITDAYALAGNWQGLLYPGIWSELLLKAAINPVNSGRTTPWTTTDSGGVMPIGDLASLSIYHGIDIAGTYERNLHTGMKVQSLQLSASEQQRQVRFNAGLIGIKSVGNAQEATSDPDATAFPAPAVTDYPTGPYLFSHFVTGTGTLKIDTARTQVTSWQFTVTNTLAPRRYMGKYIQTCRRVKRTCQAVIGLRMTSMADRDAFRALTGRTVEFKLDNGTKSVRLNMQAASVALDYQRDLSMDNEHLYTLTIGSKYDTAASSDLALTVA